MGTKPKILQWAKKRSSFRSQELVRYLGISRQNVAGHLSSLVEQGKLLKEGSTRGALYSYPLKGSRPVLVQKYSAIKKLKALEEHIVFNEIDQKMGLKRTLGASAYTIISYAFTEMLNNAIDHSRSLKVAISLRVTLKQVDFTIRDFGIGIFKNVQNSFRLQTEFDALEHVFKGKQTTDPERHSGEGIFFTSRIADLYSIRSHGLTAKVDNKISDIFLKTEKSIQGTLVTFQILRRTKKSLPELFKKYTNADFKFDKNEISVKLSGEGGLLSRSQAKRLLIGLEKYARITLDLKGVKEIGQGFADEIFRVFKNAHPEITLQHSNAIPMVELMIKRALASK